MKCFNYKSLVFLLILPGFASKAAASTWTCQQDEITRQVIVFYPNEPARLPCKVYYGKPNENALPKTLWESTDTRNYCEQQAAEFIEKLGSLGWRCVSGDRDK